MRKIACTLLGLALASGCGSGSETITNVDARASPLIGGTTHTGDPAVVILMASSSDVGECTAVFVSTTVLLTAAHCVVGDDGNRPIGTSQFRIHRGHDLSKAKADDWIAIAPANIRPHPSFKGGAHDIAVLVLDHLVDVTPLPLNTQPLSPALEGQSVRIIGYGANIASSNASDDGFGIKRQLTTTIASITDDFVEVGKKGQTACGGDSGGPALLTIDGVETIIGLDSYSDADIDCTEGEFYQRVDRESDFIAQFLSVTPPTSDAAEEPANKDERDSPPPSPPEKEAALFTTEANASSSCSVVESRYMSTPAAPLAFAAVLLMLTLRSARREEGVGAAGCARGSRAR